MKWKEIYGRVMKSSIGGGSLVVGVMNGGLKVLGSVGRGGWWVIWRVVAVGLGGENYLTHLGLM